MCAIVYWTLYYENTCGWPYSVYLKLCMRSVCASYARNIYNRAFSFLIFQLYFFLFFPTTFISIRIYVSQFSVEGEERLHGQWTWKYNLALVFIMKSIEMILMIVELHFVYSGEVARLKYFKIFEFFSHFMERWN